MARKPIQFITSSSIFDFCIFCLIVAYWQLDNLRIQSLLKTAELVLHTSPLLSLSSYCNPPRSTCRFAEEARLSSASSSYCMGPFISPERPWLIVSSSRGDGACGKTSLLNVFTRGYVESIARKCSEGILMLLGIGQVFPDSIVSPLFKQLCEISMTEPSS